MSHLEERSEKICLNCNAQLAGPFRHICGQHNIEPKETVLHLKTHFINDITHFDGKFFSTLGLLIKRPGFLPAQYMMGKRAAYFNPVRMYIFTSAIFFLIFFSVVLPAGQCKNIPKIFAAKYFICHYDRAFIYYFYPVLVNENLILCSNQTQLLFYD